MLGTLPELRLRLAHMNALFALCLLAVQPAALWCRSLDVRAQTPNPHSSESESESWESREVEPQAPIGTHTRNNIAELLLPLIERGLSAERRPAHSKKVIQVLPLRSKASKERPSWPHLNSRKKHVVEITPLRSKGRDGKPLAYILSPAKTDMRRNYPKRIDRHHADHEHKDHSGHHGWKAKKPPSESSSEETSDEENFVTKEELITNEKQEVTSEESDPDVTSEESNDVSNDKGVSVSEEPYDESLSVASSPSDETDNTHSQSDNDYTKSTSESDDSTQNEQESDYTSSSSLNSDSGEDDKKGITPPFLFSESDSQDIADEKSGLEDNELSQSVSSAENSKQTSEAPSSESQNKSDDESKNVTGEGSIEKPLSNENKTETEERNGENKIPPEDKNVKNLTEKIETTTIQGEISTTLANDVHENNTIVPHEEENEITVISDRKTNDSQSVEEHSNNSKDDNEYQNKDENGKIEQDSQSESEKDDQSKKEDSHSINKKKDPSNEGINDKEEHDVQPTDEKTKQSGTEEQSNIANRTDNTSENRDGDQSIEEKDTSKDEKEDHSKSEEESNIKDEKDDKSSEEIVESSKDEHVKDGKGDQTKKKVTITPQKTNITVKIEGEELTKENKLAHDKGVVDEKHYKTHHEIHHGSNQRNVYKEHSQYLRTSQKYSEVGPAEKLQKSDKKEEQTRRSNLTPIHLDTDDTVSTDPTVDKSENKPSDANAYRLDKENLKVIEPNLTFRRLNGDDDNLDHDISGKPHVDEVKNNKILPNTIENESDEAVNSSTNHILVKDLDKVIKIDEPVISTAHDLTHVIINHPNTNESTKAINSDDHIKHEDSVKNESYVGENINKDSVRNVQLIKDVSLPVASNPESILRSDDIEHLKSIINELQLSTPATPGYQRNDIVITQQDHLNKLWEPRSRDIIELIQTSEGVERVTPAQCETHDDKQNDHAHEHKSYRLSFLFNK